jgi:hypothetical protein
MAHWAEVEADMHSVYGFDVGAPGALAGRSWRWLKVRLAGLCNADTRLSRAMAPQRGGDSVTP